MSTPIEGTIPAIFDVVGKVYRWYSETTYETREEKLLACLAEYKTIAYVLELTFFQNPTNTKLYVDTFKMVWRSYRRQEALPYLLKILTIEPTDGEAMFYIGEIYLQQKAYKKAQAYFKSYLQLYPKHFEDKKYNYTLDLWFIDTQRYPPNSMEAYIYLAEIETLTTQNSYKIRQYYDKAIQIAPTHFLAPYILLANTYPLNEQNIDKITALKTTYAKALLAISAQNIRGFYSDNDCEYYPQLLPWVIEKYTYCYAGINYFAVANDISVLGDYYQTLQDSKNALSCYEIVLKLWQKQFERINIDLQPPFDTPTHIATPYRACLLAYQTGAHLHASLQKTKIILALYRDYWQVEALCKKILLEYPQNHEALALLEKAKQKKI